MKVKITSNNGNPFYDKYINHIYNIDESDVVKGGVGINMIDERGVLRKAIWSDCEIEIVGEGGN